MVLWVLCGCSSDSFVPPPPAELTNAGLGAAPAKVAAPVPLDLPEAASAVKAIELILNRHDAEEAGILKSAARVQAGLDTVKLRLTVLGENAGSAGTQAPTTAEQIELVRAAAARHPMALVVEPADPADSRLAQAVDEARRQGVPVVLVGQPLAGVEPDSGTHALKVTAKGAGGPAVAEGPGAQSSTSTSAKGRLILVAPPPFARSAGQLVASALRNAKHGGLDPKGGAVLLIDTAADFFVEARALALRTALRDAGITTVEEVRFERKIELGEKRLTERLEAKPKLALALATDINSLAVVRVVGGKMSEKHPLVPAGYSSDENVGNLVRIGYLAAAAEYVPTRLVRKAISTAVALARGRNVPARVELAIEFVDSAPNTGLPRAQYGSGSRPTPMEKSGS